MKLFADLVKVLKYSELDNMTLENRKLALTKYKYFTFGNDVVYCHITLLTTVSFSNVYVLDDRGFLRRLYKEMDDICYGSR